MNLGAGMSLAKQDYGTLIAAQARAAARPTHYQELLFRPISEGLNDTTSYFGWEVDHAEKKRFYVGGMLWFRSVTGMNGSEVAAGYKSRAENTVREETEWANVPITQSLWRQAIARKQFNAAWNRNPLMFHKAATVIVACELALQDRLDSGLSIEGITSGLDVYRYMTVIPACWNIDDFDAKSWAEIRERPNALSNICTATGQNNSRVFEKLSQGGTVTAETAHDAHHAVTQKLGYNGIGGVRAKPGSHLGIGEAISDEHLDRG
ncbi:hypothetical protein HKCCE2091_21580 [Rhodobacterales bacterium HKCCE2091]|nr:hypothetical protein [Rhodobacterales bacterium HKCCE2091]